ncbi:MAG TPA: hypothetical protein ENN63_00440 [Bacteroidetes bacterium]|mgnify:CR=1 FL=1|nr:hypothetical protein [Bacteroidota bacterium]
MKPQDVFILLKIIALKNDNWQQIPLAQSLKMSQSEVSQSVARSKYAGLLDDSGKRVMRQVLMDFLQYGLPVVFPAKPGAVVRGIPTAHSAPPLNKEINSSEDYVWPFARGNVRGHGITPLYDTVPQAVIEDEQLHALLALTDALRVGKAREKNVAVRELKSRIC